MLPDTGERYLTTPLFDDVAIEMNDEEELLSRSTPGYRFDLTAPVVADDEALVIDANAVEQLKAMVDDQENPVVMFALEWCEFCWSVRKMFDAYDIPYRSVDLDSVEYMADNRGSQLRAALRDKTGWNTFPQIFINGEFAGGCTDIFDDCKDGELQKQLDGQAIPYNPLVNTDPYSLLPTWLHPR